jgi:hypothetical protein
MSSRLPYPIPLPCLGRGKGRGSGAEKLSSCSFFLDTLKGLEINLLLLEGELHPASFIQKSKIQKKLETGLEKGSIKKEIHH